MTIQELTAQFDDMEDDLLKGAIQGFLRCDYQLHVIEGVEPAAAVKMAWDNLKKGIEKQQKVISK